MATEQEKLKHRLSAALKQHETAFDAAMQAIRERRQPDNDALRALGCEIDRLRRSLDINTPWDWPESSCS